MSACITGGGGKGNHGLRYHRYLFPESVDLKDAVTFAFGVSKQCEMLNKRGFLLGDLRPPYLPDEKEDAHDNMSRNTISVDRAGERYEIIVLWPCGLTNR